MKRTIAILHSSFDGKPNNNKPTRQDSERRIFGAASCPNKVGSSDRALNGAYEGLVLLGVCHTQRSVVRLPIAFIRLAVRRPYVLCTYVNNDRQSWNTKLKNYAYFLYIIVSYHTYMIWNATASADINGKMSPIKLDMFFSRIDISIGLSQPTSILALAKMKDSLMDIS